MLLISLMIIITIKNNNNNNSNSNYNNHHHSKNSTKIFDNKITPVGGLPDRLEPGQTK